MEKQLFNLFKNKYPNLNNQQLDILISKFIKNKKLQNENEFDILIVLSFISFLLDHFIFSKDIENLKIAKNILNDLEKIELEYWQQELQNNIEKETINHFINTNKILSL